MKVAIVYDRVNKWGGAERLLLSLHKLFPDAPLFTSVYNPETAKWADVFPQVVPSFLQYIPLMKSRHEYLAPLMPLAFESFSFDEYDVVISVTSEAAKGIITKPHTKHICICLTPTRYLWSGYEEYFKGQTFKGLARPMVTYLRKWEVQAAQRPDVMVAISTEVQKRIKKYYDRDSTIIFPPVETVKALENKKKDSYLVVSRLVPYKKVELVIETFNKLQKPLVIVGIGSEEKRLKDMAGDTIVFRKNLSENELRKCYREAKALVFPQFEDFGLVAVEAMREGTPVIAYGGGGALDIVKEGVNGVFLKKQTLESLTKAIRHFESKTFDEKRIIESTYRFSEQKFHTLIKKIINGR